jgi:catechol 2,3-dioxygenase-like lactoylglutathione lyase family enzyme
MFARVTLHASDPEVSERFYATVLSTLGREPVRSGEGSVRWAEFVVALADGAEQVTRGLHIGFAAPSREHVDAFWRAGTEAGYADDGAPGPRPQYGDDYYGGFLLDPDGNSAEAVHHEEVPGRGAIDHLWIRVADVAAARRFYEGVAPRAAFRLRTDLPERAQFAAETGSFSLVDGAPTRRAHMAFVAAEAATLTDPDGNLVQLLAEG